MTKLRHQLDPQPSPAIKRWVDVAGGFSVAAAPRSDVGWWCRRFRRQARANGRWRAQRSGFCNYTSGFQCQRNVAFLLDQQSDKTFTWLFSQVLGKNDGRYWMILVDWMLNIQFGAMMPKGCCSAGRGRCHGNSSCAAQPVAWMLLEAKDGQIASSQRLYQHVYHVYHVYIYIHIYIIHTHVWYVYIYIYYIKRGETGVQQSCISKYRSSHGSQMAAFLTLPGRLRLMWWRPPAEWYRGGTVPPLIGWG